MIESDTMQNIKILHITSDNIFIDSAYQTFEKVAPGCNDFILPGKANRLEHIKITPVKFVNPFSYLSPFFLKSLFEYDFVMLHCLTRFSQNLVLYSSKEIKFIWNGWGADYYDLIYPDKNSLFKPMTRELVEKLKRDKDGILVTLLKDFLKKLIYRKSKKHRVIKKVSYFSPVLENEYELVIKNLTPPVPQYTDWGYGSTVKYLHNNDDGIVRGNNILVGNSATPTNNHLEVFEVLKGLDLENRKVICPLSYGNKNYGDYIENIGKKYFGKAFIPIRDFMPFEEYSKLISSCSHVIMNHIRQQGGGNVRMALAMGAKVFLNTVNPFYIFYKEKNLKLYSIEDMEKDLKLLRNPLRELDISKNRKILREIIKPDSFFKKTEELITQVVGEM